MSQLILRELSTKDEDAFLAGLQDWQGEELSWYTFVWTAGMSHAQHLQALQEQKDRAKIPKEFVVSTMLYAFVGHEIVGRLSVRHELNANLRERGGHVGYAVSPRHRKKGYATDIFKQGLKFCKNLGLEKLLVTCADQNIPSWKIIEKFGGSLENRIFIQDKNEFVRRYWISTNEGEHKKFAKKEKVIAYITRQVANQIQLLVFDHDKENSEAGTQVPAGTIDLNEQIASALLREVEEESGLSQLKIVDKIDEYTFFREIHQCYNHRHVFHLTSNIPLPDSWTHKVTGDGVDQDFNFHYHWINIAEAKGRLSGRLDDSMDVFVSKLGSH